MPRAIASSSGSGTRRPPRSQRGAQGDWRPVDVMRSTSATIVRRRSSSSARASSCPSRILSVGISASSSDVPWPDPAAWNPRGRRCRRSWRPPSATMPARWNFVPSFALLNLRAQTDAEFSMVELEATAERALPELERHENERGLRAPGGSCTGAVPDRPLRGLVGRRRADGRARTPSRRPARGASRPRSDCDGDLPWSNAGGRRAQTL